jgi:hypothetical protein
MGIHKKTIIFCIVLGATDLVSGAISVDCPNKSLAEEVEKAKPGETITFTGTCVGPVSIRTSGLTLTGTGSAVINGNGQDAIVVAGAHGVTLANFEVRDGSNGILGQNGAHIAIEGVTSRRNQRSGISLQTGSSAIITDSATRANGLHGLDLQTGSSASVRGTFHSGNNTVFGINANGSSITFSRATVNSTGNALGVQVATSGNAFLSDSETTLNVVNNIATGLTVVSGAHMVSFGARINSTGNGVFGVSVNSKAGLDLDAGSILAASNNRAGGLAVQQESVMTVFNNPQFSGAPGFSTISTRNNGGNGIAVLTGSTINLSNQAQINSTGNGGFGLLADNGAGITIRNTTLTGNTIKDLQLTFGARADLQDNVTIGTSGCDATVLIRGAAFTCPK